MINRLRARLFGSMLSVTTLVVAGVWLCARLCLDAVDSAQLGPALLVVGLSGALASVLASEYLARTLGGVVRDLSARVEGVEHEETRLRTILDAMVEGVFVTDVAGTIVLANSALDRLAEGDVVGRSLGESIRSDALRAGWERASSGETLEIDFDVVSGGQRRTIAAQLAPLDGRAGVVAVLHDITQVRRVEKIRRDFVANASHELRTPLTAIRGFAETLAEGVADPDVRARFIQTIHFNAQRLHALVEDLLQLSRAESPDSEIEIVPIDAVEVVREAMRGLGPRALDKAQSFELIATDRQLAFADRSGLEQVLVNLVDNAIKYTPEGGRVEVRVRREAGRIVIEVADDGPGIPAKHLDRIFERFYRVDKGRSREQGGTGLGLSIVRHLVARMGGEVAVRSEVGEGTTFVLRLESAVGSLPPRRLSSAPASLP